MMVMSFICPASLGRCSLIWMPGTAVSIALNWPPLAWPGLGSKVSVWLGPPVIQSKMHALRRLGSEAASAASDSIHPEVETPTTPAAARRSQSRRDREGSPGGDALRFGRAMIRGPWEEEDSVIEPELGAVQ